MTVEAEDLDTDYLYEQTEAMIQLASFSDFTNVGNAASMKLEEMSEEMEIEEIIIEEEIVEEEETTEEETTEEETTEEVMERRAGMRRRRLHKRFQARRSANRRGRAHRRNTVADTLGSLIASLSDLTTKTAGTREQALETLSTLSRLTQPGNSLDASMLSVQVLEGQMKLAKGQAMATGDVDNIISTASNIMIALNTTGYGSSSDQAAVSKQITAALTLAATDGARLLSMNGPDNTLCGSPDCSASPGVFTSKLVSPQFLVAGKLESSASSMASIVVKPQVLQDIPALASASSVTVHMFRWPNLWKPNDLAFISGMHSVSFKADFADTAVAGLEAPVEITIPVDTDVEKNQTHWSCMWWTGTEWSKTGCTAKAASATTVTCACNHLTEFSVSVDNSQSVCGDGRRTGKEKCDDGNAADNDGCSSKCIVEPQSNCTGGTTTKPDKCTRRPSSPSSSSSSSASSVLPTGGGGGSSTATVTVPSLACPPGKVGSSCENVCIGPVANGACSASDVVKPSGSVSKVVDGAMGATLTLATGQSLLLPPGAFVGQRTISMTLYDAQPKVTQASMTPNGPIVELGPDGLQLLTKATITLKYAMNVDASKTIAVHTLNTQQMWEMLEATLLSTDTMSASSSIQHFSLYSTFSVPPSTGPPVWVPIVATIVPVTVCGLCLLLAYVWYTRRLAESKKQTNDGAVAVTSTARPARNIYTHDFAPVTCDQVIARGETPRSNPPQSPRAPSSSGHSPRMQDTRQMTPRRQAAKGAGAASFQIVSTHSGVFFYRVCCSCVDSCLFRITDAYNKSSSSPHVYTISAFLYHYVLHTLT